MPKVIHNLSTTANSQKFSLWITCGTHFWHGNCKVIGMAIEKYSAYIQRKLVDPDDPTTTIDPSDIVRVTIGADNRVCVEYWDTSTHVFEYRDYKRLVPGNANRHERRCS